MRNRGIGRARIFVGEFLLLAAVILWATALLMSPHGSPYVADADNVRTTVVSFLRNSAIGSLVLAALAGWLLFPPRRPRKPVRDWSLLGVIAVLAVTGVYQLIWLRVLD